MKKVSVKKYGKYIIFAIIVLLAPVVIYSLFSTKKNNIPPFEPKSEENICEISENITRVELINKLSDSIFGEDYNNNEFTKNPIEFYDKSIFEFTDRKFERKAPAYSVGYMYDLIMSSFLVGTYYEDLRYMSIYEASSKFLYENTVPLNFDGPYWHLNRDSACYPLFFPDALNEYTSASLLQLCTDLYKKDFVNTGGYPGSYCPMRYDDLSFITDLSGYLSGRFEQINLDEYEVAYMLDNENLVGKAKDILFFYEQAESEDICKRDAFFKKIADQLLYSIRTSQEGNGVYMKTDLMEILNTVSYGLQSGALSATEKDILIQIKKDLFTKLIDARVIYGTREPYGSIEASYIEICMRDNNFFADLDTDREIYHTYRTDCIWEDKIISSIVEASCELNDGEYAYVLSPIFENDEGQKITYASLPYTSKVLTYLILLNNMDASNE